MVRRRGRLGYRVSEVLGRRRERGYGGSGKKKREIKEWGCGGSGKEKREVKDTEVWRCWVGGEGD